MRKALLALLLLASCGPARYHEIVPRYAVLTSVPESNPMRRSVEWLARHRYGTVVEFAHIDRDHSAILSKLRDLQPSFVAVVVRPEELDANFQLALFELSCRLDPDPFPDFAWGYFLARDPAFLDRQMQTVRGADAKVERRLRRLTHIEPGAPESRSTVADLDWASRLPCRLISIKAGDLEFLHKHTPDLQEADFLLLEGDGTPEGPRGLPLEEVRLLKLDNAAVFSGASYTGSAGSAFETVRDAVARRPIPPDRSFAQAVIGAGAAALFAPLHRTDPSLIAFEWAAAILYDAPLGEAMKRNYDLAVLSSGYSAPSVGRFIDGRTAPTGHDHPAFMAMTRVLYGDPVLQPFERPAVPPLAQDPPVDGVDDKGRPVRRLLWRVASPECAPFFTDPFSRGKQRIYLRAPCPPETRKAYAEIASCEFEGRKVTAFIESQALEHWRGDAILHVLVRGDDLARKGLQVGLTVRLR